MKLYELTYLISPDLTEKEIKPLQEKIHSFIQKEGGVLDSFKDSVKKRLSYPIKRKREAILAVINFYFEPKKLVNIEKELKTEPQILRYLILSKKIPKVSIPSISKPTKVLKEEKVELKEIEKKLEEILGE